MDYQYPMDLDWSTEEIVDVIKFFEAVEKAYESKIQKEAFMKAYRRFKEIVPGKADEKKYTDEFESVSDYSAYLVIKKAKEIEDDDWIRMK
ncbi:UPF0223 family protein [Peribacillus butanolivorans]|jgi:uncharacterized protein YktA (UPF0223 family)|uniref:UPF0223 protein DTO10_19770 n=1 Tax=Peribacillus butanolivorans TaxID=421767 RepID=A0ABM6XPN9_9BACI|nr:MULTISPECIES: UPF0223 family protein [Peribacillus]AXN40385.1 hypothetical protein DTO10_19770 [Peribacillus butanolivorans]KON68343.1 hypothetical protein AKG34_05660 [Peribacillus butanolivorans]MBK5445747.1 UPF0223 family protein [Peribacillus sp. TH24]MBK5459538.1 UPF0223 family protein [Peribacillus sp. TH27]MBK5481346.1 UPF0223 family protein [Peribacillus sp. TH16]